LQQVLVLNASYEPLNVCSVRRAHVLVWKGKAEILESLPKGRTLDCAGAYREVLKAHGCSIISEHRSAEKERIEFVFRLPRRSTRERLDAELCAIAAELRGDVDWEVG